MVECESEIKLSNLLKAVCDTTRRSLLTQLCQQGPSRVTDLANYYEMSLNAVSKHIKILEKAGLVTRKTLGRTHWIEANLAQVHLIDAWFKGLKSIWELRFEKLNEVMEIENMTDLTVNITKTINAPIEKVFDAWLSAKMLTQFILPMPGMPNPQVENDAREGGNFSIIMQVGEDKIPHTGKYLEINRPNKLVFTWESPFSVDGSKVSLNFKQVDENKTDVNLVHIKFADEETRNDHDGGWNCILDCLNEALN